MTTATTPAATPSRIDQLNTFLTANPTAVAWVEETLIRGKKGAPGTFGGIKGAHFKIGLQTTDPFGATKTQILGPFAASEVPTGSQTPIAQLIGTTVIAQQQAIDTAHASNTALTAQVATLTSQLAAANAQIAALTPKSV